MTIHRSAAAVTALLDAHAHPLRPAIDRLRHIILDADPSIVEGAKWNTASYRTQDRFATLNGPRQVKAPMVILHASAKVKGIDLRPLIPDPQGLVQWLGPDRGQIIFRDENDIRAKEGALQELVHAWLAHMPR